MRALLCREVCEWDQLGVAEVAPPSMVAGGVRIAVRYASVSFAMSLQVAGRYQRTYPLPFIPGTEVAGVVLETAAGVMQVKPGDRVLAIVDWGGIAQQVVTTAATVFRLPDALPFNPAIHLGIAYATGYGGLKWRAALREGETLLVLGAAGGVGSAAVELGRAMGARVIAAASTPAKRDFALSRGAHVALPYEGLRESVKQATGGRGVDVVYDPVGGAAFDDALRCVAPFARIVTVGFAGGSAPQVPANLLLVKNIAVVGHNMGLYFGWTQPDLRLRFEPQMRAMMDRIFDWACAGDLHPHVSHCFALDDFRAAMRVIREREAQGKVVIKLEEA